MTLQDLAIAIELKMQGRMSYDAKYLKDADSEHLAVLIAEAVQISITSDRPMVGTCAAVGKTVRQELGLPKDGILNYKGGKFLLATMFDLGIVDLYDKRAKKAKYTSKFIKITDWTKFDSIVACITKEKSAYVMPSSTPYEPWTSTTHPKLDKMIRKGSSETLGKLSQAKTPMLFDVLNGKMSTAFQVNDRVLKVYNALMLSDHECFEHNSPFLTKSQANGKRMEATEVGKAAMQLQGAPFYHGYNFDFRGRIYPTSGYFHEQSSDNAKGLLLLDKKVELGEYGYNWLLIHAANCWGEDKLNLNDRIQYSLNNLDKWMNWAIAPMSDLSWTQASSCWSFLSTIMEILSARISGDVTSFNSGLICYIDGTTNGSQHLTALVRDKSIAHHVNLVPTELPGDLYTLVGDTSYASIKALVDTGLNELFVKHRAKLIDLQKEIQAAKSPEDVSEAWDTITAYREEYKDEIKSVAPQFWLQITKASQRRKIAKRNVMTLGYGSETAGFSDQLREDCPKMCDELKFIEAPWSWFMAELNYANCVKELPGPAAMLGLLKQLAIQANARDEQLAWTVPGSNFPAVQSYYVPESKQIKDTWAGVDFRPRINLPQVMKLCKKSQKQGASPNVIHSFDAAHLTMTCYASDFQTVTIHDSFGCAAGNMADLFEIVRIQWVAFYTLDPLKCLLTEQGALELTPATGDLEHEAILDSEFAFS